MTDLHYTITETVSRQYGKIIEITYDFTETRQEEIQENFQTKQEKRSRNYKATIKRLEYENLANKIQYQRNVLSFDTFVMVLRPFMMGTYAGEEIRQAFRLLDKNYSNTIDLDELSAFLPVLHPHMSKDTLLTYIHKVTQNENNDQMNFDQFNQFILKGIGRDIVCGDF